MCYSSQVHDQWIVTARGLTLSLLMLGCLIHLGCQGQTHTATKVQIQPSTPKSKLEWVAKRLQHAFDMGKPSRLAGIRVEHILSYRLKKPVEPSGDYHATVLIQTETENTIQGASRTTSVESEAVSGRATSTVEKDRHGVARTTSRPPHIIREKQAFELVYRNEQWQLAAELDSNPERLWFQYALQQ